MNTRPLTGAGLAAVLWLAPLASHAAPIWATWTVDSATTATASLPDGRTAAFTGRTQFASALGSYAVMSPPMPGIPSGENAPSLTLTAGPPGQSQINPGDLLLSLDLTSFPIDADTSLGLEDLRDINFYRIELLDASQTPLSLAGIQVSQFNMSFPASSTVADYDIALDAATGALDVIEVHDAGTGSTYTHSGLAILSNLPSNTRYIRFYNNGSSPQNVEGWRISLSAALLPEPTTALLLAASLATVWCRRSRARL